MSVALYDAAKRSLGITNDRKDDEIILAVEAGKQRMSMSGVNVIDEDDALTAQALMLYVRYWFNFQGDGEKYNRAFKQTVNAMTHAVEYREAAT